MKKIKLIAPILGASVALTSLGVVAITSCGTKLEKNEVAINKSDRFEYDVSYVGKDKAHEGEDYVLPLLPTEGYRISKESITVYLNGVKTDKFTYRWGELKIKGDNITGDCKVQIVVDAAILNIFNIESGVIKGFDKSISEAELRKAAVGGMMIPAFVTAIDDYAFYDKYNNASLIPSYFKKLVFEEPYFYPGKSNWKHQDEFTWADFESASSKLHSYTDGEGNELAGIGAHAFALAPFEHIEFPMGDDPGYKIGEGAFEKSQLHEFIMPQPDIVTDEEDDEFGHCRFMYRFGLTIEYWFKNRGIKAISDYAFHDCPNLEMIRIAPTMKDASGTSLNNAFTFGDKQASNIKVIDCSKVGTQMVYYDNNGQPKQSLSYQDGAGYVKKVVDGGYFSWDSYAFMLMLPQFVENSAELKEKNRTYILVNDWFIQYGNATDQLSYINNPILTAMKKATSSTVTWNSKLDTSFIPVNNNMFVSGQHRTAIETIKGVTQNTRDINITKSSNENHFEYLAPGSIATGSFNYGDIKGSSQDLSFGNDDLIYEIVHEEWTNGNPVYLTIKQYNQLDSVEPDYKNSHIIVNWDKTPTVGSSVDLTINVYSKRLGNIIASEIPLKLNFVNN